MATVPVVSGNPKSDGDPRRVPGLALPGALWPYSAPSRSPLIPVTDSARRLVASRIASRQLRVAYVRSRHSCAE